MPLYSPTEILEGFKQLLTSGENVLVFDPSPV